MNGVSLKDPRTSYRGLKGLAKRLAGRAGLVTVSTGHIGARYVRFPPRSALDDALLRLFGDLDGLNFIQIGANDGKRADSLMRYVGSCGWSGLMIEPLPEPFASLQELHAGNPRLRLLRAAVSDRTGTRPIHQIRPGTPGMPDWAWGLASFNPGHVHEAAGRLGLRAADVVEEQVRTITWADVLAAFGPRRCHVLQVDVEGYDIELLRLAPLAVLRPDIIQFEHGCCSRAETLAFYGELMELGYEIATCGQDTVAHLPATPSNP